MMDDEELSDDVYGSIEVLSEKGNVSMDAGDPTSAIKYWREALTLLPQPISKWDAALWLYASIGDAWRMLGDFENALTAFNSAEAAADGHLHPFVQLGLGMSLYDLGRKKAATDPLLRAYMLEGEAIFSDGGAKYLQYLKDQGLVDTATLSS